MLGRLWGSTLDGSSQIGILSTGQRLNTSQAFTGITKYLNKTVHQVEKKLNKPTVVQDELPRFHAEGARSGL